MSETIVLSEQTKTIFPYVADKAVIDLVNGLGAAQELNAVQQSRQSLLHRILDGLSGKTQMRQTHINEHLPTGLETCKNLVLELSKDIEKHSIALLTINSKVNNLESNLAEVIDFSIGLRDGLAVLKDELADLKNEFSSQKRILLAEQQMSRLMDKWAAGGLNQLSPIGRCYAVLDALYWGAFGNHVRQDKDARDFLENLRDKLIIRLQDDLGVDRERDLIRDEWLRLPENADAQLQDVLAYQGDWCLEQPKDYPTTFVATQWNQLPSQARIEHQLVPFSMIDIERVTKRLIHDRFEV